MAKGGENEMAKLTISGTTGNTTTWTNDGRFLDCWENGWQDWKGGQPSIASPNAFYEKEEVKEMRGLFHTVVVEYKTDKILEDGLVIAKDKEIAKIKALAPFAEKYDLDDLDVICNRLGDVRKKQEVQKVCVVKED